MRRITGMSAFLLFVVRSILLWLLIPFAFVAWLFLHSWAQKASVGEAICWYDQNFLAFLLLVPFRYLRIRRPELRATKYLRLSAMRGMKTYKISILNELA